MHFVILALLWAYFHPGIDSGCGLHNYFVVVFFPTEKHASGFLLSQHLDLISIELPHTKLS